ncbi:hypothetical protein [Ktedonobacter racemifer]|uniref:Uncharacterized protein n=1 Tax=Ktedonobacter racemifer DSM 44963 TaxID=485913 RepID=D6TJH7_KTERA|nr:hypothetical protein [Ktedonobacter racemifer]EFH89584.1 hypothetical protein Krac_11149 [Ktedonobacter racemifer DSM 44963]
MKKRHYGNAQWTLRTMALCFILFFAVIGAIASVSQSTAGAAYTSFMDSTLTTTTDTPTPTPGVTATVTAITTATAVPTKVPTKVPTQQPQPQPTLPPPLLPPPPVQATATPTAQATATATAMPTAQATQPDSPTPTAAAQPATTSNHNDKGGDNGTSMLLPIGGGIGFMVIIGASVVSILLMKRKQDQKAGLAQQMPRNVPWIDPQEGNVVFGPMSSTPASPAVNNILQNIFAEPNGAAFSNNASGMQQPGFMSSMVPPTQPRLYPNNGPMPEMVPPTQPRVNPNSGFIPAMPTRIDPAIPTPGGTGNTNAFATIAMSNTEGTQPRLAAMSAGASPSGAYPTVTMDGVNGTGPYPVVPPTGPQTVAPSQPLASLQHPGQVAGAQQPQMHTYNVAGNFQPLPMDLPPELKASLENQQRPPKPSQGPLSFSGLQDDPFLEEMMQQAQMGIFVMPNQDKTNDNNAGQDAKA